MYLFTWDGIPCDYYGTEQGFAGGVDPKKNPTLGYTPWATDHDKHALVHDLIQSQSMIPWLALLGGRRRSRARLLT